jgi:hypothetical protein
VPIDVRNHFNRCFQVSTLPALKGIHFSVFQAQVHEIEFELLPAIQALKKVMISLFRISQSALILYSEVSQPLTLVPYFQPAFSL